MFCCQTGSYGLTFWVPTIVKGLSGYTEFEVGLFSAVPYIAAALGMLLVGRSSDRSGERFLHVAMPSLFGALGFIAVGYMHVARTRDAGAVRRRGRRLLHARPFLGIAGKISGRQRRRRWHRAHQFHGRVRRRRRTERGRLAEGPDRRFPRRPC